MEENKTKQHSQHSRLFSSSLLGIRGRKFEGFLSHLITTYPCIPKCSNRSLRVFHQIRHRKSSVLQIERGSNAMVPNPLLLKSASCRPSDATARHGLSPKASTMCLAAKGRQALERHRKRSGYPQVTSNCALKVLLY